MQEEKQEITFEAAMHRLAELIAQMESGELSLEDTMRAYEEGTQLAQIVRTRLESYRTHIDRITGQEEDEDHDRDDGHDSHDI